MTPAVLVGGQRILAHVPIAPSYYGPHYTWQCVDGHDVPAPGYV